MSGAKPLVDGTPSPVRHDASWVREKPATTDLGATEMRLGMRPTLFDTPSLGPPAFRNGDETERIIEQAFDFIGGRRRTRTFDPLIKSQLLYQLSYAPGHQKQTGPRGGPVKCVFLYQRGGLVQPRRSGARLRPHRAEPRILSGQDTIAWALGPRWRFSMSLFNALM
jgi:hypothetical protein